VGATTSCDGTNCSVRCDSPGFFLDDTGCHPGAIQIAANQEHGCALLFDGTLRCWGNNFSGQLGIGEAGPSRQQPVVPGIDGVLSVRLGRDFTCALRADRSVWCWGDNSVGQLGRGAATAEEATPAPVPGIEDALELSVGTLHACVTRPSGLYCWGDNSFGQLGIDPAITSQPRPIEADIEAVNHVFAGGQSTCVQLASNGAVRCLGQSLATELVADAADRIDSVATSGVAGCVLLQSNAVRCWGQDGTNSILPVPGLGSADSIAVAERVACAVGQGVVSCWGDNDLGQLGRGTTSERSDEAAPVSGLDNVAQLSVGNDHVCALRTDGSVWCWGSNQSGQLGTYKVRSSALPIQVERW
jgi:alpha-tubulin suppressor-like RCC1 family protein